MEQPPVSGASHREQCPNLEIMKVRPALPVPVVEEAPVALLGAYGGECLYLFCLRALQVCLLCMSRTTDFRRQGP